MNLYEVMPVFACIEGDEYHLVIASKNISCAWSNRDTRGRTNDE